MTTTEINNERELKSWVVTRPNILELKELININLNNVAIC